MKQDNKKTVLTGKKNLVWIAGLFMIISAGAGVIPSVVMIKIANYIVRGNNNISYIIWALTGVFIFLIAKAVFYVLSLIFSHVAAYRSLADIRDTFVTHLKKLTPGFFQKKSSGDLAKIINHDVEMIELYLAHALPELFAAVFVPMMIITAVFIIDWKLGLCMVCLFPFVFLMMMILSNVWKKMTEQYSKSLKDMSSGIMEFIATIPVIKAFSREENRTGLIHRKIDSYRNWATKQTIASIAPMGILGILLEGGFVVLIIFGSIFMVQEKTTLDNFIIALLLGVGFYGNLARLFFIVNTDVIYKNSIKNLNEILNVNPFAPVESKSKNQNCSISIQDVNFSYEKGKQVLKDINIEIPEGSFTAIIGKSGSGKTTIANLLMRFWITDDGKLTIGGRDIKSFTEKEAAGLFSRVDQNVYLFNTSILENIRLGNNKASDEEVIEACKKARIYDFIQTLPGGINTSIGEAGARLSGGQKQRISIARCILKDAPIIILDEATASIDPYNEKLIHEGILELSRNKTLIVIAHHLDTIKNADQIIVMDNGEIAAKGTHKELAVNSSLYMEMWNKQMQTKEWQFA